MGSTLLYARFHGGVEKKNEEELSWWYFEDGSFGHLVVYMEGEEWSNF